MTLNTICNIKLNKWDTDELEQIKEDLELWYKNGGELVAALNRITKCFNSTHVNDDIDINNLKFWSLEYDLIESEMIKRGFSHLIPSEGTPTH